MKNSQVYTFEARTKEDLLYLIKEEIKKFGNKCDLNHIDVSLITNFSELFWYSRFNGDISEWDVSSVKNMAGMFQNSRFNGDISGWDVSGVENMNGTFFASAFRGDISRWNVSCVENMSSMFRQSAFGGNVSDWNRFSIAQDEHMFFGCKVSKKLGIKSPSFDQVKSHFLNLKLEADLKDALPGQSETSKVRL